MREVDQDLDALLDDLVAGAALDVGDESDAAGIVFVSRIVESLPRGQPVLRHDNFPSAPVAPSHP